MATRSLLAMLAALLAVSVLPDRPSATGQPPAPSGVIALIVHQSNPVNDLTLAEARRIFMMETQTWPHGRKITVLLEEKGQPSRTEVIRLICGISEAEYDRHILLQTFRGSIGWGPRAIGSASAMLRFVFNAPGAIGYVPIEQADGTTKVLRIDGFAPADPKYPLRPRATTGGRPPHGQP